MSFHHIAMAILVAAVWGFNFIAVKSGLNEMPPYLYGAGRFVIAALPALFVAKPKTSWAMIIGIGLTLGVFKFTLMFMGIHYGMSAGLASLVLQSQAFFTLLFSFVFFKSKIRANQLIGMSIAAVGMILIATDTQDQSSTLGFVLILSAAVAWGVANILYRLVGNVDMFALTAWSSIIPPIPMFLVSVYAEGWDVVIHCIQTMTTTGWLCLAYTACISSWIGATLWAVLIKSYPPHKVAPFSLLVPVFGITFASLILGEQFSQTNMIASALIFLGLIINQWRVKKAVVPENVELDELKKAA
ncbi:MAG: EamA family transporter [Candidatus Paracaedibacteraceae bacterium]|nr:EamA family transporter [Candidatus Paracaedibacteraceae bacterium]